VWGTYGKLKKYLFYDLANVVTQPWLKNEKSSRLLNFEITYDTLAISHSRKDYNFIDLLGDIGGINYLFSSIVSFFFVALSEFNLLIDVFNILFRLKESDAKNLFDHDGVDRT
jgi:hypothetical protein